MKKVAASVLAMLSFTCGQAAGHTKPIFREVTISEGRTLALGQQLAREAAFCDWSGTICILKRGAFGGANSIKAQVSEGQRVTRIEFEYGVVDRAKMGEMLTDYERLLGQPLACTGGEASPRWCVWRDPATEFSLTFGSSAQGHLASATMSDLKN